jgi:hypothetical protein
MRRIIFVVTVFGILFVGPAARGALSFDRSKAHQINDARNDSVYPFVFHSGFWINLHHFLYEQAAERNKPGSSGSAAGADKSIGLLSSDQ